MGKKVTAIAVWDAARTAEIAPPGGTGVLQSLARAMHIQQRLGEPGVLTLRLIVGCPAATAVEGDAKPFLRDRRILRRTFDDGSFDEWRITEGLRDLTGRQEPVVKAESLWIDLAGSTPRRVLTGGFNDYTLFLDGLTAQQALDELISPALDVPPLFQAGTVVAALASSEVNLAFDGSQSHLDGLRQLTEQLRQATGQGEVEFVWNSGAGKYDVNIEREAGWSAAERTAGSADPTKRPIEVGPGTAGNRLELARRSDARKYFSRVVPLAGPAEETVTIGQATWTVASGSGTAVLTLDGDPVWADDVLIGAYFGNPTDGWRQITDSASPNQITLASALAASSGRFAANASGDELTYLAAPDEAAGGRVDRRLRRSDVPPFDNLLAVQGISADLSDWSGGLPVGWSSKGASAITEVTGSLYVKHGTSSAKVEADADDGIKCVLALSPTDEHPWHSIWVHVYVEQGQIKIDAREQTAGTVHPTGQVANSTVKNLVAIVVAGIDPPADDVTLRILATEDTTVFYVDAVVVVNSPNAYPYAPVMGPRALWKAAAQLLNEEGGLLNDLYSGRLFDADELGLASTEPILVGSHVQVRDGWDGSTHAIDFTTRVVELVIEDDPVAGALTKQVGLSRLKKDFRNRFAPPPPRPGIPVQPYVPSFDPDELPTVQDIDLNQVGSTVTMTVTFNDPNDLLAQFEYRTAVGRNLATTDTWTVDTEDSPKVYSFSVAVVEEHDSYMQFRYTLTTGQVITAEPVPVDHDTIPNTKFQYEALWNGSNYEIKVYWDGSEDTKSVRIEMTSPETQTKNKNGRSGSTTMTTAADPGDTVAMTARGYSQTGQAGNTDAEDWSVSLVLPDRAPGVNAADIFGNLNADQIIGAARNWSSDVRFYVNDNDRVRWTAGTLQYDGTQSQSISSGNVTLSSSSTTYYVYFDPGAPQSALRTTTSFTTATANNRFVMALGWRASVAANNASYVPVYGAMREPRAVSVDELNANVVTAVKANIGALNALSINTGALTVTGLITDNPSSPKYRIDPSTGFTVEAGGNEEIRKYSIKAGSVFKSNWWHNTASNTTFLEHVPALGDFEINSNNTLTLRTLGGDNININSSDDVSITASDNIVLAPGAGASDIVDVQGALEADDYLKAPSFRTGAKTGETVTYTVKVVEGTGEVEMEWTAGILTDTTVV